MDKRLIDANALKMALCTKEGAEALGHSTVKLARVSAIVETQPTVSAVEVVRCKDCKGWCTEEIAKQYGVDRYCTMTMMPTDAYDFCSCGERREE